jgi:hypothetical protein
LYIDGVLTVVAGLPGDYNEDGLVDAADYTVWRDHLGSVTMLPNDDTLGVDQDDYTRWQSSYRQVDGHVIAAASNVAAPEPTALMLAVSTTLALTHQRTRTVRHGRER